MMNLKKKINNKISLLGFDVIGYSQPIVDSKTKIEYRKFLKKKFHGQMSWLENHYEKKINPKKVWNEVKTIVVVGLNYAPKFNPLIKNNLKEKANISVYAHQKDYHNVIGEKLKEFKEWLFKKHKIDSKYFVDSSPVMEKYFAKKTKVGWLGKHTNIVSKEYGSWLFLSEIFLPISFTFEEKSSDNCGICRSCIDVCPTNAIISDYKIDARKCISYLTIEHKGPFPMSIRDKIGNKVYGCDDCLSICPWNKFAKPTEDKNLVPEENYKSLNFFLDFDKKRFYKYFSDSPIKRIGWISFLRNVIIATGNSNSSIFKKKLEKLLKHESPIIRGSTIWSLGKLSSKNKIKKLLKNEKNKYVLYELNSLS
ncbi:MAG: tRNA epoxyqueuosine(34) reductase QueG [Alphaproteobacteria bacterium]|nr:tRNA epoxyqueuosine(34) reductase QueG [Alphaproteobacteria bacterium]